MNAKKLSVIALLLILLSALTIVHAAAVIAIDLGSEFIKVGIRKSGSPIDVVLNEQSKRKTPAMIGFRGKDRFFGESAKSMSTRFPGQIFRFLTLLSGKQYSKNSDLFKRYHQDFFLPYKLLRNRERNGTIDVLPIDDSSRHTPEELLAMIFQYLKGLAAGSAGAPVTDAVITIPPYFNFEQRQSLLDAAALADINVLALQHSTTAAALQYGITKYKSIKELEQGKAMNVVIVDMGSTSVKVCAVTFNGPKPNTDELGQISVKAVSWDDTVGGTDLDARLVKFFLNEFKKKYGKDLSDNNRVTARLFAEAKKHKEILSANEKTLVIIEALADDKDLKLEITREQFVEMIKDLINKVVTTVDRTIKNSGLKADDIEAVELIGGGARVPAIQNELKNALKKGLSFSLNSDEAIATGSAYYAATLTTFFNAKSFSLNDIFPYQVDFTLSNQEKEKAFTLLKEFEELTARKSVNIPRKEDFTIALKYNKDQYEGIPSFAEYDVKGVDAAIANLSSSETSDKPKVRLTFRLSGSGMLDLESAVAQAEVITMVSEEEKKESKKDNKKEEKKEDDKKTEEKKEEKTEEKKDEKAEEKKEEKTEEKKEVKLKQEKKLVKINLSTNARQTTLRSLTKDQKAVSKAKLAELAEHDRIKQTIAKNRNDLEGYIYSTRAKLLDEPENEFKPYYTEEQVQKLNQLTTESDDWLSSDAQDFEEKTDAKVVIETYANKIKALKDIAEPIYKRKTDREEREKAVEKCKQGLNATSSIVQTLKNETHITPEEIEGILKSIEDVEAWLKENLAKQAKVPFNEPSIIYANDVDAKCFVPAQKAMKLLQKPKPKPKPEVKIEAQNTTSSETKTEGTQEQEQKPAEEAKPEQQETPKEEPKQEGEEKKTKDEL